MGYLALLTSDQGGEWKRGLNKEMMKILGIQHHFSVSPSCIISRQYCIYACINKVIFFIRLCIIRSTCHGQFYEVYSFQLYMDLCKCCQGQLLHMHCTYANGLIVMKVEPDIKGYGHIHV